jgi:hypothetical protein
VADEFDLSFFQDKPLDHGCFSPLSMLCPHEPDWPARVVPLQVGVLQSPVPSARRCYKLGQALRRAIESYPEDIRVAIVATGGLSHQVHGERAGFNNPAWDARFLDMIEKDPVRLTEMTQSELAHLGGFEGAEVIMWLVMRGALSAQVRKVHQTYYLPSMTGIATAIYENEAMPPAAGEVLRHRARMGEQLAGVTACKALTPFDLERSVKCYRINKFLRDMVLPAHRAAFLADEDGAYERAGLSEHERRLVRQRDWRGLIQYGAIFFGLEKLGAVVGVSNLHIYAAMRGSRWRSSRRRAMRRGRFTPLPARMPSSFAPVAWVARVPNVLVVNAHSGMPAQNLKDLVAQAQGPPRPGSAYSAPAATAARRTPPWSTSSCSTGRFLPVAHPLSRHRAFGDRPAGSGQVARAPSPACPAAAAARQEPASLRALAVSSSRSGMAALSRRAHRRRERRRRHHGLRGRPVVRRRRAGGHTGGTRDAAEPRDQQNFGLARGGPATGRRRRGAGAGDAAGLCRTHRARDSALARGGACRERQAGVGAGWRAPSALSLLELSINR